MLARAVFDGHAQGCGIAKVNIDRLQAHLSVQRLQQGGELRAGLYLYQTRRRGGGAAQPKRLVGVEAITRADERVTIVRGSALELAVPNSNTLEVQSAPTLRPFRRRM